MVNPTRTTTVNYRYNPKVGDYQPQSMVVVVTEELDRKEQLEAQVAEQAELKVQFDLQQERVFNEKEQEV